MDRSCMNQNMAIRHHHHLTRRLVVTDAWLPIAYIKDKDRPRAGIIFLRKPNLLAAV